MKKNILSLTSLFICICSFAQNPESANQLVDEGIVLHDKGEYIDAIKKYDKALLIDVGNLLALSEKSLSLISLKRYEEAIKTCQVAIQLHPGEKGLKNIYVNYGDALDGLKQPDKSIAIYDEGIKLFPSYYNLYFNKAITQIGVKDYDNAIINLQQSVKYNPEHIRSHTILARILYAYGLRIPSVLAYCRALVLECEGSRAEEDLANLQKVMLGNIKVGGDGTIDINVNEDMLSDTTAVKENNFSSTDLVIAMSAGLDYDSKYKNTTDVEKFIRKFKSACATLKETQKKNYGFYWDYYAPYFIEMSDKGYIDTFAYIAFTSTGKEDVYSWLKSHKNEVDDFYRWSKSFEWSCK
jgi:tetratricopeptide (TPR) repeat protein